LVFIIDGRLQASLLNKETQKKVDLLKTHNITPGLAVILVGEDPASQIYVASKCQQANEVGIASFKFAFPAEITEEELLSHIAQLNTDARIHGILVQLPLPQHLNTHKILQAVHFLKDVDGLHPRNIGLLAAGHPYMVPCTPLGCMRLIKGIKQDLTGLKAVIIGASLLVGRPLMQMLLNEKCTTTVTHIHTRDIKQECVSADILIAAAGVPHLVKADWVKPGAIVIDVGINRLQRKNGEIDIVGDIDFDAVKLLASAITPVPGGVGPMTVACLLENTVKAAILKDEEAVC
jgi:methylenetetrahydrofolate dehydrogenase (NADP+)/methenyltetrahydrofolate cyclohydrolase